MNTQTTSLKDKIQNLIMESIFASEFKPQQILTEKTLIDRYGCSKSPVREALVSLCSDGVLRNIPRCGYEVIRLTKDDIDEILNYRLILESGLLKSCYNKITKSQLLKLEALDELCNQKNDLLKDHWENNCNFHLFLISCSGNQFAYNELKRSLSILYRAYAQYYWLTWDENLIPGDMKTHKEIIASIQNKNVDNIEKLLSLDLNNFGKQ